MKKKIVLIAAFAALCLASCGDSNSSKSGDSTAATTPAAVQSAAENTADSTAAPAESTADSTAEPADSTLPLQAASQPQPLR